MLEKKKLIPQPSYTGNSFLLHIFKPMLEAKQSHVSRSRKRKSLPPDSWHLLHGVHSEEKKRPFPKRSVGIHYHYSGLEENSYKA